MIKKTASLFFILIILITYSYSQKSPDDFFGIHIGADRTLVKYPDIIKYFKYIDAESEHIKLVEEGQSTLGNPIFTAFISSQENINQLRELVNINKKLANPDTISKEEARRLLKKAKVFVLITCALHATEIASTQMSMIFAHKLATSKDPSLLGYLDDAVIMLMPSINPDGNIMVTEWYNKYVNTEYEGCRMPYLYHHYAGHDNNRDFYMLNLKETRVVNAVLHHKYFPHIFLDMHQMGSTGTRMFVPPFYNPLNQNLDPLLTRETDMIGTFMALKLQQKEKKGVASSYGFDAYWPGGSKNTAWYKNVVGVLTELASVRIASPIYIEPNELRVSSKGLPEYKAQVNFPDPWTGGWWRLNDIMAYELIAVEALLEIAAKHKETFLGSFYKMGITNVDKGNIEPPYAYVIPIQPHEQWDIPATYTFLKKMEKNGVRIYTLEADIRSGNHIYPRGSFVIPMSQPFRGFIKVMMERQRYPEIKYMRNGPVIQPYDASGWTLPLQMGVHYAELLSPLPGMKLARVKDLDYPEAIITVNGEGNYYCIPAKFNRSAVVVNRLHKKGTTVFRYIKVGDNKNNAFPVNPGDFLVKAADTDAEAMGNILAGTGVSIKKITIDKPGHIKKISPPRIGIYQSYRASMDEGWTRWVLDHFEFTHTVLHNKDFIDKKFSQKYDVIIFPDMSRDTIVKGTYRPSRSHYTRGTPPEYRGGIETKGVETLKKFVQQGGTIVLFDSAADLGSKDFSLPFYNIMQNVKRDEFYCPGSILKIKVDSDDPMGWGMEKDNIIFFSHSPAFRTRLPILKSIDRKVVAGFNAVGPHLLSGYIKGEKLLDRAVMIIRFDYYKGNVIVLGGRIQHRAQTFGTFKFLFNSIYYAGM
jgi:hypothetical protein